MNMQRFEFSNIHPFNKLLPNTLSVNSFLLNACLSGSLLLSWMLCILLLSACGGDHHKVNHTPIATEANFTTQADTELKGTLMGSDIDGNKLTYAATTQPTQGSLIVNAKGSFVYIPNADTTGTDYFTFTVSDGKLASSAATVNIMINPLEVSFSSYSRKVYAQDASAQPLPINTRHIEQDVTESTAYDDLLQ